MSGSIQAALGAHAKSLILSKLVDIEDRYLYLVVSAHALSAALVRKEAKVHRLVYHISKKFNGDESDTQGWRCWLIACS